MSMPGPIAHQWADSLKAIDLYRAGRLSHRQVGEALSLDYWQTETFLTERGVALNYSATDLETDAATLQKILDTREGGSPSTLELKP